MPAAKDDQATGEGSAVGEGLVRRLAPEDLPEVVDVLADAFRDYPVIRFVLGDAPNHDDRVRELVGFFARARVLRSEPLLGLRWDGRLAGVALVSFPDGPPSPPTLASLREEVWGRLGSDARARYGAFTRAAAGLITTDPHIHLNMIGVRRSLHGRGLGHRLIDAVHRLAGETPDAAGVTLTTEDPANVPIYRHLGYRVTGEAEIVPGVHTWAFFRPNSLM